MGILIEHYAGAFPLWLSPDQVQVISVNQDLIEPAQKFAAELSAFGIRVWLDDSNESVGYKIRKGEKQRVPYMVVFGEKEIAGNNLQIRIRGEKETVEMAKADFITKVVNEIKEKI